MDVVRRCHSVLPFIMSPILSKFCLIMCLSTNVGIVGVIATNRGHQKRNWKDVSVADRESLHGKYKAGSAGLLSITDICDFQNTL